MSTSFLPASLPVLAKWTRYLGYFLVLRFFWRIPIIVSLASSTDGSNQRQILQMVVGYLLLILAPAITLLIIPRWVEDGYVWAFTITCAITLWSIVGIFFDGMFLGTLGALSTQLLRLELAATIPSIRVVAAIFIAFPDVRDVVRTRRRRNRVQGFEPIMSPGSSPVAAPMPRSLKSVNTAKAPSRSLPQISPPIAMAQETQAPVIPRFIPESMVRTAAHIRGIGGVMLIFFFVGIVFGMISFSSERNPDLSPLPMIARATIAWLVPGIIFMCLSPRIDEGRRWAVITVTTVAAISMLAVIAIAFISHSANGDEANAAGAILLALIASIFYALILTLCSFIWRDARDVSRTIARDRRYAQQPAMTSARPAPTAAPPPFRRSPPRR